MLKKFSLKFGVQWKLVLMFVMVIFAVVILAGVFFYHNIRQFYDNEFRTQMKLVFSSDLSRQLQEAVTLPEESYARIKNIMEVYSGSLGRDSYRNYYILRGSDLKIEPDTDSVTASKLEITPNMISAMAAKVGDATSGQSYYMDYAYPVKNGENIAYIIYIKDTKEEVNEILYKTVWIVLQALFFGLMVSVLLGFFLSKTITSPIESLTKKAEMLASGDFEGRINLFSNDEIGTLTKAFNKMADNLQSKITEIAGEKNKMDTIFLHMNDGVLAFDEHGVSMHINRAARMMLRLTGDDLNFDDFVNVIGLSFSINDVYNNKGETFARIFEIEGKTVMAFFAPLENYGGAIAVLHDITEQTRQERSRREFVANVSHELRTPITTIKSYTETILDNDDLPLETSKAFLQVVVGESDRMTRLISDLLILSRLDHSGDLLKCEEIDMDILIENVCKKLEFEAKAKSQELFYKSSLLPILHGDRDRVEQVLSNIISNAIKYTQQNGEINVYAKADGGNIIVSVKDNGIGIPQEDLPRLFERFYRVDKARSRESGGTGLGLAIAKEIIEAHGGSIDVKSKYKEGTEVVIILPI